MKKGSAVEWIKQHVVKVLDAIVSAICKAPKVINKTDTVQKIVQDRSSIARFGDGELAFIFGRSIGFQQYDYFLAERLKQVLKETKDDQLLIGLSKSIFTSKLYYYQNYRVRYLLRIRKLLSKKEYYSADISRFYRSSPDGSRELEYLSQLKRIWDSRNITLVEGEKSRMGVGNDLFNNAHRIRRILCPAKNAFSHYAEILEKVKETTPKSDLLLIALGPTATVLAYDLFHEGFQAVDIGHVDISYEWFLRGVSGPSERIAIPGKYVNEVGGCSDECCQDEMYLSQIVASIGIG